MQVAQGMVLPPGSSVVLQVLWPAQLHKGSNEDRDNGLILRLIAPGLRILFLDATAESTYALTEVMTSSTSNYLQAEIVQMIGEVHKPFLTEVGALLQQAHPSLLVITPASLSSKQRKTAGASTVIEPLPPLLSRGNWQVVQTAQMGTLEIDSKDGRWSMS